MLSAGDLILLPFTQDLTLTGISYACHGLPSMPRLKTAELFPCLRQIVSKRAIELSFLRHISARNVPHHLFIESSFTPAAHARVSIGGRLCQLISYEINCKSIIQKLRKNPEDLLSALAVAPSVESPDQFSESDLFVFSFLIALIAPNLIETKKAASAGRPLYLIYPLPANWSRRSSWESLGILSIKNGSNQPVPITLVGLDENRNHYTEEMTLSPQGSARSQRSFYSLTYLHLADVPTDRLEVHSSTQRRTRIIGPHEWGNIWVYGIQIYLVGWITRREFNKLARPYQSNQIGVPFIVPRHPYLAMPILKLHPMEELYSRAIVWGNRQ